MWHQVGRPSLFEGKTFLPLHGMPMSYSARSRTRLADWLPEPFTVPTRMARSLTEHEEDAAVPSGTGAVSTRETVGDMMSLKRSGVTADVSAHASGVFREFPGNGREGQGGPACPDKSAVQQIVEDTARERLSSSLLQRTGVRFAWAEIG